MVQWIVWVVAAYVVTAVAAWTMRHRAVGSRCVGAVGILAASAMGVAVAGSSLLSNQIETKRLAWNVPYASLSVGLDQTTCLFLLPVCIVAACIAVHTMRRLPGDYATNRPHEFFPALAVCLAGVVVTLVARNAVLFLFGWELMTLASFFLIENDQRQAKRGGWVYLSAGHIGCAALFAMFALMAEPGSVLDYNLLRVTPETASVVFVLACVGFGGKIGLAPMHAYYPESYPQAPAHTGALLSGIVGNAGVYGLIRILLLIDGQETMAGWWGYLLLAAGLTSALLGAARSLTAVDLSRLLAWSSVENYGLMAAGLGLGLIGAGVGNGIVSCLGFTGAIVHMVNHSLSKSLLFLCAGTVYGRTGTRNLDAMGGLGKRLPLTGGLFLLGALGAASVPPLSGFAGEFLLLMSAYKGVAKGYTVGSPPAVAMFLAIIAIGLAAGLAVAAYVKAFGFVFLGNPKGAGAASSSRERPAALLPHAILAVLAVASAVFSRRIIHLAGTGAGNLIRHYTPGEGYSSLQQWLAGESSGLFGSVFLGGWILVLGIAVALIVCHFLLRGKSTSLGPTWDCGYASPDSRMQYTASSFARPLAETVRSFATLVDEEKAPDALFPSAASFTSQVPGIEKAWGFAALFRACEALASRVRIVQGGRVQLYLLYLAAVLVILLLWKL